MKVDDAVNESPIDPPTLAPGEEGRSPMVGIHVNNENGYSLDQGLTAGPSSELEVKDPPMDNNAESVSNNLDADCILQNLAIINLDDSESDEPNEERASLRDNTTLTNEAIAEHIASFLRTRPPTEATTGQTQVPLTNFVANSEMPTFEEDVQALIGNKD
jgi:hypothetical protein